MSNGWGGPRKGAGRKRGSLTKKTSLLARAAAEQGITPIELMLATMRELWARACDEAGDVVDLELAKQACAIAKDAAPYVHPRLSAVDANVGGELTIVVENYDDAYRAV